MKTEQDLIGCLDELYKLCRVCLCENSNTKSDQLNPYWESLFKRVMSCMQIEFLIEDNMLPCKICDLCCKELEVADKLRIKCENSSAVLKRIYQQYLVKDEQKQSNVETYYDSPDDCCSVSTEDNKEQIKDVILQVNIEESAVNVNKQIKGKKKNSKVEPANLNEVIIKTEENGTSLEEVGQSLMAVDKNLFNCDICNKQLKSKRSIIHHISKQHSADKMTDVPFKVTGYGAERRFHCPDCSHTTKRKIDMTIHLRVHTGVRPHACDICSRSFTQHSLLASHKLTHFDVKYFTCQECGKQFKDRKTLRRHTRVHSNEMFVCKLCNKGLKSEESLSFHMQRHSQIKNVSCELCGATFVSRTELCNHKHRHTNVKRFYCTQCDYSCHWRKSLLIHTRRHLKDKTIQCDECEYACYTNAQLTAHKRKHSKEQNYPCPMCDKKFKQSSSVNKHCLKKHGQRFIWGKVADRRYIK